MKNQKTHYECYSYKQYKYLTTLGFEFEYSKIHDFTKRRFWVYEITTEFEVALKAYTVMRDMVDTGELKPTKQYK